MVEEFYQIVSDILYVIPAKVLIGTRKLPLFLIKPIKNKVSTVARIKRRNDGNNT